jgi:tRNA wybutosine-synthesizing protein 3
MDEFLRRKKQQLLKSDRSSIGGVDDKIKYLCEKINKNENYYTTSSCGGRIVLIKNINKKQPGLFFYVSHDKIKLADLIEILNKAKDSKEDLIFKQESCILAVACRDLESASKLLDNARENAGWKNSGVMSLKKRILCELRSTENLALPIMVDGKLLVGEEFLKILVEESNKRLELSWQKINKLEKLIN